MKDAKSRLLRLEKRLANKNVSRRGLPAAMLEQMASVYRRPGSTQCKSTDSEGPAYLRFVGPQFRREEPKPLPAWAIQYFERRRLQNRPRKF